MTLESFTGSGSTPSRRRFWDKLTEAVNASQKIAGHNVTVDEHPGMGSVINVPDRCCSGSLGACCVGTDCTIQTESDCIAMSGDFQGIGTICDPNPCGTGACCFPGALCFDGYTATECEDGGGIFQGGGTDCDPNPCESQGCCPGVFTLNFSDPPIYFLQRVTVITMAAFGECPVLTLTITETVDPTTCETSFEEIFDPDPFPGECGITPTCVGDCADYAISDTEAFCDSGVELVTKECTLSDEFPICP